MLFYNIFISVLLLSISAFASNKMTYYGCPEECETQEKPSCGKPITTDYFAALSTKIGDFCDKYVVVMETKSNASKLVRAKVVDTCSSCPTYHVDLSKKAFTSLTKASVGKSDIIWAIYDGSGSLVKGPYYNSVSSVASSYGLSSSSFISAFKIAAGKLAKNGSSTGNFSISRDGGSGESEEVETRKTTTRKEKSVVATTKDRATSTSATSEKPTLAPSDDKKSSSKDNKDNKDKSFKENDKDNNDTITYENEKDEKDEESKEAISTEPKESEANSSPIVIKPDSEDSTPAEKNKEKTKETKEVGKIEEEEEGGNTGATVGLITAITCVGAGGVGLAFIKKKNPTKYEELKKSFPDAFNHVKTGISRRTTTLKNGIRRSVTKMRGRQPTLPITNNYMPASTVDAIGEDGIPRITLYDNPTNPVQSAN